MSKARSHRLESAGLWSALFALILLSTNGCQLIPGQAAQQRAQAVLANWDAIAGNAGPDAIVVVGGLLTGGGWNGPNADNDKVSVMSGLLEASPALSSDVPPTGSVVWPDGSSSQVSLISASDALDRAVAEIRGGPESGKCDGCTPVKVVGAKLTTQQLPTSRGLATVPVWQLQFQPADAPIDPITVPAVKDAISLTTSNSSLPLDDNAGTFIDAAYGDAASSIVTVAFVGSPYRADKPCGSDYSAQAVESDRAVAVIVSESRNLTPAACSGVGATRTAQAQLKSPLGNRVVLEIVWGTPVAVKSGPAPPDPITN